MGNKSKCLVTGGCGFIGSNLVKTLIHKGYEVVSIDNLSATSHEKFHFHDECKNYEVDIRDSEAVSKIFSEFKPDYVFHCAAHSRIQPTMKNPSETCEVNVVGTCNILQASRENGVKKVVYSGTSSAYGLENQPPLIEEMERDCLNPYSVSKTAGEDLCKMYWTLFGLPTTILRYFNVYGPNEPIKGIYAPVVGLFMRQAKSGEAMTVVGDGLQSRDYTHVQDVVEANIAAALSEEEVSYGQIFNVGSGEAHTVLDVVNMIGGPHVHIDARPGEARHTLADNSKLKNILGWQPKGNLRNYINSCM